MTCVQREKTMMSLWDRRRMAGRKRRVRGQASGRCGQFEGQKEEKGGRMTKMGFGGEETQRKTPQRNQYRANGEGRKELEGGVRRRGWCLRKRLLRVSGC